VLLSTLVNQPYKYGFVTNIESDTIPRGLSEDVVRLISAKKNEPSFMLEFRLKAYRQWQKMTEPTCLVSSIPPLITRTSFTTAPKQQKPKLNSLEEVDPTLLEARQHPV